jgi:hypothetical protein
MKHSLPLVIGLLFITTSPAMAEEQHREQGAHVHGIGQLNVVQDGSVLLIELISPAANIVGFEHAAETPEQQTALANATHTLEHGGELFLLPSEGECKLVSADIENSMGSMHGESHEHEEESHGDQEQHAEEEADEHQEGHSDFEAHYKFSCSRPEALDHMTVKLFQRFPNTEKLNVQLITNRRQGAAVLTADNPRLDF